MRQAFNLLLLLFLTQFLACGDGDADVISGKPDQEEIIDPSGEPQDTLSDVFQIECSNYAPQLYLSVTDKDANSILDCDYDSQRGPKEGYVAIKNVRYTENYASNAFSLTYDSRESNVVIYPEEINSLGDRFEETGDSVRFYGNRPISGVADSVVMPVRELWLHLAVEWTNADIDTFALRYSNTCDIQLTQVCLRGDSIGYNRVVLIKE